jgi:DNA-binding transcriptional regulator PaaX
VREPGVPIGLLAADWPGPDFRRAFDDFRTAFVPVVEGYVSSLFEQHASVIGA